MTKQCLSLFRTAKQPHLLTIHLSITLLACPHCLLHLVACLVVISSHVSLNPPPQQGTIWLGKEILLGICLKILSGLSPMSYQLQGNFFQ